MVPWATKSRGRDFSKGGRFVTPWILELSFSKNFFDLFMDLLIGLILHNSLDLKLDHIFFPCSSGPWFPSPFPMIIPWSIPSKTPFFSSHVFLFQQKEYSNYLRFVKQPIFLLLHKSPNNSYILLTSYLAKFSKNIACPKWIFPPEKLICPWGQIGALWRECHFSWSIAGETFCASSYDHVIDLHHILPSQTPTINTQSLDAARGHCEASAW